MTNLLRARPLPWVIAAALCLQTVTALGQADDGNRAAARELGARGVEAFKAGDYRTAEEKLSKAYRLLPAPSLGLWLGRALASQGKVLAASEQLLAASRLATGGRDVAVQDRARADAAKEREALLPRIPAIVIQVEGASTSEVSASVDGAAVSGAAIGERFPVEPGEHEVKGAAGERSVSVRVSVKEGEQKAVLLRIPAAEASRIVAPPVEATPAPVRNEPAPVVEAAPPASPLSAVRPTDSGTTGAGRLPAYVALGVGAAGIAVGTVTGIVVLGKQGTIEDSPACTDFRCQPEMQDTVDTYNTLRTVSTVSFIAGGAFAALGVGLLVLGSSSSESSVAVRVGPLSLQAAGRF